VDFKFWKRKREPEAQAAAASAPVETALAELTAEPAEPVQPVVEAVEAVELPKRSLGEGVRSLFLGDFDVTDLEDILLRADFGVEASEEITAALEAEAQRRGATSDPELRLVLKDLLTERLMREDSGLNLSDAKLPYVFLVVGVNGAGKTTTIGKLARWLSDGQWRVVLGAADTFRAAAVEQLATWAQRAEVEIVKPEREGQDPASVAYQTVALAIEQSADIAIIDTAGRLQNKKDLMDELGKIRRAVEKQAQVSEVLLVIDATTGQNALAQARAFAEIAGVSGIVMTKLDGTAKGGILYAIQRELNLPIKLVGVGEGVTDFAFFDPEEFARGLVAYRQR
jgi:fused signal recognition particle receptor